MQKKFNDVARNDNEIIEQCEALKQIIGRSFTDYGADILITVKRHDGDIVEAKLFDDANIANELYDALSAIIDNLS